MPTRKFGGRKRDNPISVYFSEEVRERLEDLVKRKGLESRSKLIEDLVREGLSRIEHDKRLMKAIEGPNPFE